MDKYLLYKQTFKNDNITPDEYYKHVTSGLKSNRFQSLDSDFATTMLNLYVHNKVLLDKNIDIDVLSLDSIILPVSDPDLFKDNYSATLLFKKGLRECKSINKVIREVLSKYDTKSPNDVSLYNTFFSGDFKS